MVSRPGRLSDCLVRSDLPQPRASLQVWKDFPRYLGKATKELRSTVGRWNSDHKQSDSGTHLIRAHRPNTCGYFVQLLYGFWCYMEWCEHISVSSSSKTRCTHILRRTVLHGGGGIYPYLADAYDCVGGVGFAGSISLHFSARPAMLNADVPVLFADEEGW